MGASYRSAAELKDAFAPVALVADDDVDVRRQLRETLEESGLDVAEASTGAETIAKATATGAEQPDVILLDYKMDVDGLQVLRQLLDRGVEAPIIMMTGVANGELAARAIQMGAVNYLGKPFEDIEMVTDSVLQAVKYARLKRGESGAELLNLKVDRSEKIIGVSPQMINVFKLVGLVARTPVTVVMTGETGVGKEMISEEIHLRSDRHAGPFIKINCAAQPESLLESLLFGHEKGSFTGANAQHKGYFEAASKGTILLDEIGEMSLHLQAKLLRVLQDRKFERVGSTEPITVDVRVLAATHRNLQQEVRAGRFRADLYYRLDVVEIHIPPLRERLGDIPLLVSHFLDKHRYSPRMPAARITQGAVTKLQEHSWPGNVRELENVIQRAVVFSQGEVITEDHIIISPLAVSPVIDVEQRLHDGATLNEITRELQYQAVRTALQMCGGDTVKAARQLDIPLDEMERYGLTLPTPALEHR